MDLTQTFTRSLQMLWTEEEILYGLMEFVKKYTFTEYSNHCTNKLRISPFNIDTKNFLKLLV